MTTRLDRSRPLFHWSPRDRRAGILRLGLMPGSKCATGPILNGDGTEWAAPWICLALDPQEAWLLSHGLWRSVGTFDLWQTYLTADDQVRCRRDGGRTIIEVRVHNRIPKRRLFWVGERTTPDLKRK